MATGTATRTRSRDGRPGVGRSRSLSWASTWALRVVTVAGLAVDAWVHADLAVRYDPNQGASGISQGDLFRLEAAACVLAAAALLLTARPVTWLLAWLVAGSALAGVLLYRYHDPGAIGPLPDMYEPVWFAEKTLTALAEAVAVTAATLGLLVARRPVPRAASGRRPTG
jgi:hypothetical protein